MYVWVGVGGVKHGTKGIVYSNGESMCQLVDHRQLECSPCNTSITLPWYSSSTEHLNKTYLQRRHCLRRRQPTQETLYRLCPVRILSSREPPHERLARRTGYIDAEFLQPCAGRGGHGRGGHGCGGDTVAAEGCGGTRAEFSVSVFMHQFNRQFYRQFYRQCA